MAVTIPKTQYIGVNIHRSTDGSMPLGFLTPGGTDAAAKKRISTVDSWVGKTSSRHEYIDTVDKAQFEKDNPTAKWIRDNTHNPNHLNSMYEIPKVEDVDYKIYDNVPNEPRFGFRITKSISRGGSWSGSNKVVRIEDPRGFELEISVDNLVKMMSMTTFIEGVCQEECVWGRDGANNVLLPVNSDPYKEAFATTEYRNKEAISLRDVNFGDTVELKKTEHFPGLSGIYLGAYHVYSLQTLYKSKQLENYSWNRKKGFDFVKAHKRYVIKNGDKYFGVSSCKIHKIHKTVETPVERSDIDPVNYKDMSQTGTGTPIVLTTNKLSADVIAQTAKFVKSDDVDLLKTHESGSATLWAKDNKTPDMMLFTRAYYSHHYSHLEDQTETERLKLFEGEVTRINMATNTWEVTAVRGEGGKGPFHILKNPLAKAALSIDDYDWYQIAFTVNDKECRVPVQTLSRW